MIATTQIADCMNPSSQAGAFRLRMTNSTRIYRLAALGLMVLCLFALSRLSLGRGAQQSVDQRRHRALRKIKHIVFIVKENRTFDNYFGTFPGADGATFGTISTGDVIPLGQAPDQLPRDISHSFQSAVLAIDGGAMDQFNLIPGGKVYGDLLS